MRAMRHVFATVLVAVSLLLPLGAQESTEHLNPVIAKLAAGKTVYGLINTGDLSLANARETARAPVDFVYADMEHSPLDFPGLAVFLAGLTDKAAIVAKKSAQPNVTLFARFPPEADQSNWVVKQALDIGLMGVIFNGVDTKDQALTAVRTMRYPPMRGAPLREPVGIRGYSTAAPSYAWGVSAAEYERRADVWPLNPEGDLLAVIMIESVEGVANLDQIAGVPGVGALFLGAGSDLSRSMGVPATSPEVEAAFQQVLKACQSHKVACGITAGNANDIVRRVKEGWRIIRSTVPAITQARMQLGDR
jgi:4-hydroxy-2-oxoheptanedioate aldolase